jgi:hypothetical protein
MNGLIRPLKLIGQCDFSGDAAGPKLGAPR